VEIKPKGCGLKIRRAAVDDAPKLAKVHVDSWQVAYRGLVPDSHLQKFTYQRREEAFRRSLAANQEETYLLEDGHQPVAILTIGPGRDSDLDISLTGELWGIYIAPDYWRRGIGRKLVQEAERMLQARGYREVALWVLEGNSAARRFYEAEGFSLDGVSRMIELGQPLKAVRYRKLLATASIEPVDFSV
jgi:ribosomal protein S18 acetylase RimI-like enzyme